MSCLPDLERKLSLHDHFWGIHGDFGDQGTYVGDQMQNDAWYETEWQVTKGVENELYTS